MENIRNHIYLAAMLHDIGKFYQRADSGSVANSEFLSIYGKNESDFCPLYKGQYTHKHVLWTAQFIEDFKAVFNNLLGCDNEDLSNRDSLLNLAAGHHLSKDQLTDLGIIIKEADCLSSGMDRESESAFLDDQDESSWDSFKHKRMTSILQTINKKPDSIKTWWHLPVNRMILNKDSFPKEAFDEKPNYGRLWHDFIGEFKFIQANTYHAFSETLLNLLYKYATSIPSSTINFPDISLYDHLKTTAALAVCLYDVMESGEKPDNPFMLVGADFSGIQSYIYEIVSKHAGKNLKGRSFYLRMLSDSVVRYLLKQLNLFQANVVYNSGGGFYIIAPNTSSIRLKLQEAISEIENRFFESFSNSLYVAIDYICFSKDALMHRNGENLGEVWGNLFLKRDKKKQSRYASSLKGRYNDFFMPIMAGGDTKRDIITGEEFGKNESVFSEGSLKPLKAETKDQLYLGKKLRDYEIMVISDGEVPYWKDKHPIEPAHLGFFYYFLKRDNLEEMKDQLRASADKVTVVTPNGEKGNCDFLGKIDGIDNIYALDFYGGNEIAGKRIPTFEEMCETHDSEANDDTFKRLGILRMDVDNLGSIFQKGILPERATLSRYATLSRSFDFFFSGYLNTIWREIAPEKSLIIYSGGDDLFIVGNWTTTLAIAKRIKKDFSEYTCGNDAFSISGGISLVTSKFPIMKAAEESADEEENAKNHTVGKKEKNSISFLGVALNWDVEYPIVESLKDTIVRLIETEDFPKSFISKMILHLYNANIVEHKIKNNKTYWMLTYDLSRMKGRTKNIEIRNLLDNCIKEVCKTSNMLNGISIHTDYHPLELWAFACRWAELELRTY